MTLVKNIYFFYLEKMSNLNCLENVIKVFRKQCEYKEYIPKKIPVGGAEQLKWEHERSRL